MEKRKRQEKWHKKNKKQKMIKLKERTLEDGITRESTNEGREKEKKLQEIMTITKEATK